MEIGGRLKMASQWRQLFEETRDEVIELKKEKTAYRKMLREARNWMMDHGFSERLQNEIKELLQNKGIKKKHKDMDDS